MGIRYPFVDVTVGDTNITQFLDDIPDTLVDFSFDRTVYYNSSMAGCKFSLTLYDDSAIEIEDILTRGINSMHIRYGWADNGAEISSSVVDVIGTAAEYGLSFESSGTSLTVNGTVSSYASAHGSVATKSYDADTYKGKQSEVVKAICEEEGWEIGYIEPTTAKVNDDGEVTTFVRNSLKAGVFCNNLALDAQSEESGEVGYRFYFGEDGKVYFFASNNTKVTVAEAKEDTVDGVDDQVDGNKVQNVQGTQPGISTDTKYTIAMRYWVGDERFSRLSSYGNSIDVFITQDGAGVDWFQSDASVQLNSKLRNESGEVVILGLGINDLNNYSSYISAYKSLMERFPNVKFIIVSVNPIFGDSTKTDSKVKTFNSKIKMAFPNNFANTYSQIYTRVKKSKNNGMSYDDSINKTIYDLLDRKAGTAYSENSSNSKASYGSDNQDDSGIQVSGHYEYYSGRGDNTVLSFSPEFKGLCSDVLSNSSSYSIDAVKNEMIECTMGGSGSSDSGATGRIMGLSSSSKSNLEKKSIAMWNMNKRQKYQATMEIIGDTTTKIGTYIYVAVYTKYGILHHTSGIYFIKSATDNISGGMFTTTLQLEKHGTSIEDVRQNAEETSGEVAGNTAGTENTSQYTNGSGDIVDIALGELGTSEPTGDDKYISWYGGFSMDVHWCAIFVSWCANKAGIPTSVIPKYSSVSNGMQWFKDQGKFKSKGTYTPKRGDIFFQKSNGASHTGLVVSCDGSNYVTIEGNCSDAVKSITRSLSDPCLTGFGVWQ